MVLWGRVQFGSDSAVQYCGVGFVPVLSGVVRFGSEYTARFGWVR